MIAVAWKMLRHTPARLAATVVGIAVLFFLSAAQVGLLVGWCNTCSAIIRHAGADVWLVAEQTAAFDYGTAIPSQRVYQARGVAGVAWAEGMVMAWNTWQRPDGRRINVELVGLDHACAGGPWDVPAGEVGAVHRPDSVLVDELYLGPLGVGGVGAEAEMFGRRAVVRGVTRGVRTITASPFVFTSIKSARAYDRRYRDDEITYVLVGCADGVPPEAVRDRLRAAVPGVEALTAGEFAARTMRYWMLETGIGITVVLTAVLGFVVSLVVISQTLFAVTQEHLDSYATLLALGFNRRLLLGCVLAQCLILCAAGAAVGAAGFAAAVGASARTPIPIETTPAVFAGLVAASAGCGAAGAVLSLRAVLCVDPATVFRA